MDPTLLSIWDNWTNEFSSFQSRDPRSRIAGFMASRGVASASYSEHPSPHGSVKTISNSRDPANGFAILQYPDNSLYFGSVRNGLRDGDGTRTYANSPLVYVGQYSGNKKNGFGRLINARTNQVVYEGEWRNDMKEGNGHLLYEHGTYNGMFKSDFFHGRGKLSWRNGDVFDGDFHRGERTGRGIMKFGNGDSYEGEFLNGLSHGTGTYVWRNGEVYVGDFRDGQLMGQGTVQFGIEVKGQGVFGPHGRQVIYDLTAPPQVPF